MQVYTLYLNTAITSPVSNLIVPVNVADKANATWMVDFRSLFNGANEKYRRCSLKFSIQSNQWTAAGTDWNNYNGYLTINIPSRYGSSTTNGTQLGMIYPVDVPTTNTTNHCFLNTTLNQPQGIDILAPGDNTFLNVRFLNNDSYSTMGSSVPDYQLLLQFEFSEPWETNVSSDIPFF